MKYDFVVIGAGVSGITSAITLAKNGFQVALLEKAPVIAPLLRGFSRKGVHFDTGFHYTGGAGPGEPFERFLRYLGVMDRITPFSFNDDGFDVFRYPSEQFEFRVPTGYEPIKDRLCETFPRECGAIRRYLEMVRAVCAGMPYLNIDADIESANVLHRVIGPTLKEILDSLTENRLLKSILSMHTLLYGVSSDQVTFAQHASIVGNYYQSIRGIRGGGLSLSGAFGTALDQLGVEVRCGCGVKDILISREGKLTGVRLENDEEISATSCIATVHPHQLLAMVPEEAFRPVYRKRLAQLEETVSAFIAYAVCGTPVTALAGSNMFIVPDSGCFDTLGGRSLENSPFYLSAAYAGESCRPGGFIGIFPAKNTAVDSLLEPCSGKRSAGYRTFKKEIVSKMQSHIENIFPEIAGTIEYIEGSTPATIRDYCNTPYGGLYGVKHMSGQYNPHPVTRVKGLFLAGQAVVSPGIMGAVLSGFLACGTILGHDHLRKELREC
jgi:all-trans-retinol 13,14-reductase